MNDNHHQHDTHDTHDTLCNASQRAVDSLVDSSMDIGAVPAQDRPRAAKASSLFKLACDSGKHSPCSDSLIDRTLARVTAARAGVIGPRAEPSVEHASPDEDVYLIPDDEEAVDAFVAAGYRADRVNSSLRPRAAVLEAIVGLLTGEASRAGDAGGHHHDAVQHPSSQLLVERTLAAVRSTTMAAPPVDSGVAGRIGGMRLADVFSLAAALILGVSVMWPVLMSMRTRSMKAACGANMATVASAMGSYAGDYREALPQATASFGGPTWWDVGTTPERSNSANLFQLPKQGYAKLKDLACPGNASACKGGACDEKTDWDCSKQVSYSYHVMFGPATQRPRWGQRSANVPMVVLADKSPVIARAMAREVINPLENSPNHGGDGQWGMATDGSAMWLTSPQRGDDNIWLPGSIDETIKLAKLEMKRVGATRGVLKIKGNEVPSSSEDMFVGP